MTGFEIYLQENGFELIQGRACDLNTHNNTHRKWKTSDGGMCVVGIFAHPNRIGITYPDVFIEGKPFTSLPNKEQYEYVLSQILGEDAKYNTSFVATDRTKNGYISIEVKYHSEAFSHSQMIEKAIGVLTEQSYIE